MIIQRAIKLFNPCPCAVWLLYLAIKKTEKFEFLIWCHVKRDTAFDAVDYLKIDWNRLIVELKEFDRLRISV